MPPGTYRSNLLQGAGTGTGTGTGTAFVYVKQMTANDGRWVRCSVGMTANDASGALQCGGLKCLQSECTVLFKCVVCCVEECVVECVR